MITRLFVLSVLSAVVLSFSGCAKTEAWFGAHKTQFAATGNLIATSAATIAERTVYQAAVSAADAYLKNQNVQGFGDALRGLESSAIANSTASIPDFVMQLRNTWLGPQQHYTDFANQLGTLLQSAASGGGKISQDQLNQIIESAIKGLQTSSPEALKGA